MTIKIALAWHNPDSGNLGCSALAVSNYLLIDAALSRSLKNYEIHLFGDEPESIIDGISAIKDGSKTSTTYNIISIRNITRSPLKLFSTFKTYSYVFDISAGDSFSDIYGWKRFVTQAFFKYLAIKNSSLVLCPQTIGPFNNKISRLIARNILNHAKIIFTRDPASSAVLQKMGITAPHVETTDVAFTLPYEPTQATGKPRSIGINVSGLLAAGGYNQDNQFNLKSNYLETIEHIIKILKSKKYEVFLVPHVLSAEQMSLEDDLNISKILAKKHSVKLSPIFRNPIEAKSFIASLDLFIGSRMHATIASLSSGVPVIPLAYSDKFDPLFTALRYPHTINLLTLSTDSICAEIESKIDSIDMLKNDASIAKAIAAKKVSEYTLELEKFINHECGENTKK